MPVQSSIHRPLAGPVTIGPKVLLIGILGAAFGLIAAWLLSQSDVSRSVVRVAQTNAAKPLGAPAPLPQTFKPLTPDQALAANAALPVANAPVEPAPSFRMATSGLTSLVANSELDCLTAAVYYEAAGETEQGQRAVAQVVLNRVRHPSFPHSICGVVYQGSERTTGCQFTFTCDGSLARKPSLEGWARAQRIARDAIAGAVETTVGMATHYHTVWVVPYWAPSLAKITTLGAHIFYRWEGYWGRRAAFTGSYTGETFVPQLADPGMAFDAGLDGLALATGVAPNRTRLLADEGNPALSQSPGAAAAKAMAIKSPLAADEGRGSLVVDEEAAEEENSIASNHALAEGLAVPKVAIP